MSSSIMSPLYGPLQDMTERHMLSGDFGFNKRFDPSGPLEQAFEAGGWKSYLQKVAEEKKKRTMQNTQAQWDAGIIRRLTDDIPQYLRYMEQKGISGLNIAVPNPYTNLWD